MPDWEIQGVELANCNCSYGCPCQFNALPTHGYCSAAVGFRFDRGYHGDVRLDGLRAAVIYRWPGPVHEGDGEMQVVVDEQASDTQRDALLTILTGGDTEPMATMWAVFGAMAPTRHEPLSKPIDLSIDVDGRTGHVRVPGVFEIAARPIRNPVTGMEHRARIDLPHGFEYEIAEIGSGTTRATGRIRLTHEESYAQFARLHLSNTGVVRGRAA